MFKLFTKHIQIHHTYQLHPKMLESYCGNMGVYFLLVKAVENYYWKIYFTKQYIFDCGNDGGAFWVHFKKCQSSQFSLSLEKALSYDFRTTLYIYVPTFRSWIKFPTNYHTVAKWGEICNSYFARIYTYLNKKMFLWFQKQLENLMSFFRSLKVYECYRPRKRKCISLVDTWWVHSA